MMHGIVKSPFALLGVAAALMFAVSCSDDEDDAGDDGNKGGSSGSDGGTSGTAGSNTGGSTGGTTGGSTNGGTTNGGTGGRGGTAGSAGTSGAAGDGGGGEDMGGMGGVGGTDGGAGGAGGEGGEVVVYDVLDNPGFELGNVGTLLPIPGWEESGDLDASYVEWTGGRNASHKLGHWRLWVMTTAETYSTNTFQRVAPIQNGTYTFSMWINRKLVMTDQHLFARGHNMANPTEEMTITTDHANSEAGYTQISLTGIVVTSGEVTVGIHTNSWGGDWSNIDDAALIKDP